MKGLKVVALVIIFLLLVTAGLVFQAGRAAEDTVFNQDYYREILEETELNSYLHKRLQERIFNEVSTQVPERLAGIVTQALLLVFDENWLEEQVLILTDDLVLFVKGEQPALQAAIDLTAKKEELRNNLVTGLAVIPEQLLTLIGFDPQALEDAVQEMINKMPLPDRIELSDILAEQGITDDLTASLLKIRQYRGVYTYLPYAAFIIFFVLSYLLAGLTGAIKWFGAAALVSGLIFFILLQGIPLLLLLPGTSGSFNGLLLESDAIKEAVIYSADQASILPVYYTLAGLLMFLIGLASGRFGNKAGKES